jgi:hypothetical protein
MFEDVDLVWHGPDLEPYCYECVEVIKENERINAREAKNEAKRYGY